MDLWEDLIARGGWDYNVSYTNNDGSTPLAGSQANLLSNDVIRTNSFFRPFIYDALYTTNGNATASDPHVRPKLLSEAIPAVSCAAGANNVPNFGINNGNGCIDMQQNYKNPNSPWARESGRWLHGDFKEVAYYFVYQLYDDVVSKGVLK